jgi:HAD superfamily hydrolase (TIGR01549 family)
MPTDPKPSTQRIGPARHMPDPTVLRALILDFDGTIADTIPLCIEAYRETLFEHVGARPTPEEVIAGFGPSEEGMLEQVIGAGWREAYATFLRHYERMHADVAEPFGGAVELFEELEGRGIRLGIVTGKGRGSLDVSLRVLGLDRFFSPDTREAGSPRGAVKPECITRLLARFEVEPNATAYLGDMPSDVHAAREVGVHALAATWASNVDRARLLETRPDRHFDSFGDLRDWWFQGR